MMTHDEHEQPSQALTGERINQKARTRVALLEAAAVLLRSGGRPTIDEVATAARISKRTAYRYFVSQEHLLADAALETLRPRVEAMLTEVSASQDVHARVASLAVALSRLAEEHIGELREMIRASLTGPPWTSDARPGLDRPRARGGRRLEWIQMSIEPLRAVMPADKFEQLTDCLAVCLGIDALMVLRDVCGLTGASAEQRMVWMATAILDHALNDLTGEAP